MQHGFALRVSILYGAIFLVVGSFTPYFPVWLDLRGLDARDIGIVLAAPLFARIFFTPAISYVADRMGDHRRVLIALAWGTGVSCLLFSVAQDFWPILTVAIVYALFWTTVMPLTETVAMAGVRHAGVDYGRMRLWGSLTFIAVSFSGGMLLQAWGPGAALWLFVAASACVVIAAHIIPVVPAPASTGPASRPPRIRLRDAIGLFRSPLFLLFLFTTSTVQAAHAVFYAFGTLHWQSLGISTGVIGLLWSVGVLAEIVLFAVSGRAVRVIGAARLIWLAGLAGALRWAVTAFDPPLALLFAVQLLHGLTFGAAHLGAIHFISASVPQAYGATAQGLYASVTSGLAMGLAMAAAGPLYGAFGGRAFLVMAGLSVLSLIGGTLLVARWRSGVLVSGV